MNPMYLVDESPQMLPTTTLGPKPSATAKSKRYYSEERAPSISVKNLIKAQALIDPNRWWWIGAAMTSIGGVVLLCH